MLMLKSDPRMYIISTWHVNHTNHELWPINRYNLLMSNIVLSLQQLNFSCLDLFINFLQKISSGALFWSGPKRCPHPITFDVNNVSFYVLFFFH